MLHANEEGEYMDQVRLMKVDNDICQPYVIANVPKPRKNETIKADSAITEAPTGAMLSRGVALQLLLNIMRGNTAGN